MFPAGPLLEITVEWVVCGVHGPVPFAGVHEPVFTLCNAQEYHTLFSSSMTGPVLIPDGALRSAMIAPAQMPRTSATRQYTIKTDFRTPVLRLSLSYCLFTLRSRARRR